MRLKDRTSVEEAERFTAVGGSPSGGTTAAMSEPGGMIGVWRLELDAALVRELAGDRYYVRGVAYHQQGPS